MADQRRESNWVPKALLLVVLDIQEPTWGKVVRPLIRAEWMRGKGSRTEYRARDVLEAYFRRLAQPNRGTKQAGEVKRFWEAKHARLRFLRESGRLMERSEHDRRQRELCEMLAQFCDRSATELALRLGVEPSIVDKYMTEFRNELAERVAAWEHSQT